MRPEEVVARLAVDRARAARLDQDDGVIALAGIDAGLVQRTGHVVIPGAEVCSDLDVVRSKRAVEPIVHVLELSEDDAKRIELAAHA